MILRLCSSGEFKRLAKACKLCRLLSFLLILEPEDETSLTAIHVCHLGVDLEDLSGVVKSKLSELTEADWSSKLSAHTGFRHIPAHALMGSRGACKVHREAGFYPARAIFEGADVFHGKFQWPLLASPSYRHERAIL